MSLGVPSSRHALEEAANTQKVLWSTFQGPSSPLRWCPAHGPPAFSAGSASGPWSPGSIHSLFSEVTPPHLEAPTWVGTRVTGGWISHKRCLGDCCQSQCV